MPTSSPALAKTLSPKDRAALAKKFSKYSKKPNAENAAKIAAKLHRLGIKAVAFDMDGTLVDSEHSNLQIAKDGLAEYKVTLTPAEEAKYPGHTIVDFCQKILEKHGILEAAPKALAIAAEKPKKLAKFLQDETIKVFEKVLKLVKAFDNHDLKLALVTSSNNNSMRQVLRYFDLEKYFEIKLAREDFKGQLKPKPYPYRLAMTLCGIDPDTNPQQLLVVEDSVPGLQSALSAGATTIEVKNLAEQKRKKIAGEENLIHLDLSKTHP